MKTGASHCGHAARPFDRAGKGKAGTGVSGGFSKIAWFKDILSKPELVHNIIKDELVDIKNRYGDERRTKITIDTDDIEMEDLVDDEDIVVTFNPLWIY